MLVFEFSKAEVFNVFCQWNVLYLLSWGSWSVQSFYRRGSSPKLSAEVAGDSRSALPTTSLATGNKLNWSISNLSTVSQTQQHYHTYTY